MNISSFRRTMNHNFVGSSSNGTTLIQKSTMNLTYNEPKSREWYIAKNKNLPDFQTQKGSIIFFYSFRNIVPLSTLPDDLSKNVSHGILMWESNGWLCRTNVIQSCINTDDIEVDWNLNGLSKKDISHKVSTCLVLSVIWRSSTWSTTWMVVVVVVPVYLK